MNKFNVEDNVYYIHSCDCMGKEIALKGVIRQVKKRWFGLGYKYLIDSETHQAWVNEKDIVEKVAPNVGE